MRIHDMILCIYDSYVFVPIEDLRLRQSQKEKPQGWQNIFCFLYMELLFFKQFWWRFSYVSYEFHYIQHSKKKVHGDQYGIILYVLLLFLFWSVLAIVPSSYILCFTVIDLSIRNLWYTYFVSANQIIMATILHSAFIF
jgi:hypothetical protein